jgi:hypothetical protein
VPIALERDLYPVFWHLEKSDSPDRRSTSEFAAGPAKVFFFTETAPSIYLALSILTRSSTAVIGVLQILAQDSWAIETRHPLKDRRIHKFWAAGMPQ